MALEGHSYQDRSHPRPVVTVQKAFVTHGKRASAPVARREAARVISRVALVEGQGVPNVRRGGVVRGEHADSPFEHWSLPRESIFA